jgi:ABC-2 type transport system permease protein
MTTLLRILARRLAPKVALLCALVAAAGAATLPSYASTYQTDAARAAAVELAARNGAALVLYGRLEPPGHAAAMFVWEMGAFITIGVAVVAVLVAAGLTRGLDTDGTVELARSAGVTPRAMVLTASLLLVVTALTVGASSAAGLLGHLGADGVTLAGTLAWGAVVGTTFLLIAALTALAGQLVATVGATRGVGLMAVGAGFLARAAADTAPDTALDTAPSARGWLTSVSPLGLRGAVSPFGDVSWRSLLAALAVTGLIGAVTGWIWLRRELHAALLRPRTRHTPRLRVRGVAGFVGRTSLGSTLAWTAAIAALTGFFVGMGGDVVASARAGRLEGGLLEAQLGRGDPTGAYLAYVGTIVGVLTAAYAVLHVLRYAASERTGTLELVRGTGRRPWAPLVAYAVTAAGAAGCLLVVAGVVAAGMAAAIFPDEGVATTAWHQVVGQWPGVAALAGLSATVIGVKPRWAALAWSMAGVSAILVLLGSLLHAPEWLVDLAAFGHVPMSGVDVAQAILVGAAILGTLGGGWAVARRDLSV